MSHTTRMMTPAPAVGSHACVCHCGRDFLASSGGVANGDSISRHNVGEHTTMTTVEVDADSLARLYDMAKSNHERTGDALEDSDLDELVKSDLQWLYSQQGDALGDVEQALEQQADVNVGDL